MAQDDFKDAEYQFPEGYEYFKDMADDAARRSKEIDEKIKNIPTEDIKQTRHRLQFNGPGMAKAQHSWDRRESREDLEKQKNQIETDLMKRIDRDLVKNEVDADTASQVKNAAIETLHPNPFKNKTKEELEKIKPMEKDQQHSQDYMRKLLHDHRQKGPDIIKTETATHKQQTEISMSAKFNQNLGYTHYTEQTRQAIGKQPVINKGKEPDRE